MPVRVLNSIGAALLSVATSLCLAYALFGAGFCVCTTPQATEGIGNTFSGWENSVFPKEDMATIAEAARAFSIEGESLDELYDTLYPIICENYPEVESALQQYGVGTQGNATTIFNQIENRGLANRLNEYLLPDNALSHLQDCTALFQTGRISTGVVAAFGIAGVVLLWVLRGRKWAGRTVQAGALLVLLLLVALAAWAIFDFNSLFTWMHSLLFAQGNWTFPASSLLIQLFPEAFWAAMAALWVLVSVLSSLVVLIIGKIMAH